MWIGTDQGINRYSGVEFKNYDLDDSNKIKGKEIVEILNVQGNIYAISTSGSLIKYNYDYERCSLPRVTLLEHQDQERTRPKFKKNLSLREVQVD